MNTYKKLIYKPDLPVFSTTEDAVINPAQMGQSALGAGTGGNTFALFGMGGQESPATNRFTPIGGNAQQQAAQQWRLRQQRRHQLGKQSNIPQGEKLLSFLRL